MSTVTSRDGTTIAYTRTGEGPAVILVDGALCYRAFGPATPLAERLAGNFTVYTYDRRGRGESGDTEPYHFEREVEDLEAVIEAAGGSAYVYGISSGAALALETAAHGAGIKKLALYEIPYIVDDTQSPMPADFVPGMRRMIAEGRPGDAVKAFMKRVGTPGFAIAVMRLLPVWSKLKSVAHTLPYDLSMLEDNSQGRPLPTDRWATATVPTLVLDGGKSAPWIRNSMHSLAQVLPEGRYDTIAGQNHMLKADAVAPVLISYFTDR